MIALRAVASMPVRPWHMQQVHQQIFIAAIIVGVGLLQCGSIGSSTAEVTTSGNSR
ncbi:hypothetical protein ACFX5Q_33510 [Mesorhizobium sp. IMUNJ 23033]|uniref:hypothetical protein n=1 Tax=Mesorhizobium sp. IMUNJ 23033 TaxID=3378039 RepID=UPI00384ACCC1